jgi:hypothetical protein
MGLDGQGPHAFSRLGKVMIASKPTRAALLVCALALSGCSTGQPTAEPTDESPSPQAEPAPEPTEASPDEGDETAFAALVEARNRFHAAFEDFRRSGSPVATQSTVRRMRRAWDDFSEALEEVEDAGLDLTTEQLYEDILTTTDRWIDSVQDVTRIAVKCRLGVSPSPSELQACIARYPDFQVLVLEMVQLTAEVARQQQQLRNLGP